MHLEPSRTTNTNRCRAHAAAQLFSFKVKKNCLAFLRNGIKNKVFFENDGRSVHLYRSQMSGNPVRIRDGCATVTGYKFPMPLAR